MKAFLTVIFSISIAVFLSYSLIAVSHALKFKYLSHRSRKITFLFIAASIITLISAISIFFSID